MKRYYSSHISPTSHSHLDVHNTHFSIASIRAKEKVNNFHSKVSSLSVQFNPLPLWGSNHQRNGFIQSLFITPQKPKVVSQHVNIVCRLSGPVMLQLPRMLSRLCLSILSVVGFILQNVIFLIYMHYIVYAAKWYCKMIFTIQ